jgi:TetR/AcrR family transcriptional regulator, transcriptional repressor for nem operon
MLVILPSQGRFMNAKADRKQRSHETILDSASSLLRQCGIAGTRVADVMKGAGLTVGGFYAHFDSKEALVEEALRRTTAELRARLFTRIDDKPAADRAAVILKRYLSSAHRDEHTLGCPFPAVVGEVGTTVPEYRNVLGDCVDALARDLEALLPQTVRSSRRRAYSLGVVALMYGGLALSRALVGSKLSDEVLTAARTVGIAALRGLSREANEEEAS